jgi:type IV pilus assembly protein PilW
MMQHPKSRNRGISLLEILIAMVIGMIVLSFAFRTFLLQNRIYDTQMQITEMIQTARATIDLITREVRMAGYSTTNTPIDGVIYNPSQLQVHSDLNADGDTDDEYETIAYTYDSASLQIERTTGGVTEVLADNVSSFQLKYHKADGSLATATSEIRKVLVMVTVRTSKPDGSFPYNSGYRTHTLTSVIKPRNLDY